MELKKIALFIDSKITELYRSRSKFCASNGQKRQAFNNRLNNIIYHNKDVKFSTIEKDLNLLGYELVIKKIDD